MTIKVSHFLFFLVTAIAAKAAHYLLTVEALGLDHPSGGNGFAHFCAVVCVLGYLAGLAFIVFVSTDEATIITIPNPFSGHTSTRRARAALKQSLADKYILMATAKGADFDRLNLETAALEEKLSKL